MSPIKPNYVYFFGSYTVYYRHYIIYSMLRIFVIIEASSKSTFCQYDLVTLINFNTTFLTHFWAIIR